MRAVEFFSGIGAFSQAVRSSPIEVVAAFDQSEHANSAFLNNFGHKPSVLNLDSIKADRIPPSDLWWLSPPCTPFTRRGQRLDIDDPRARPLLNLIDFIPVFRPANLILENVEGFERGKVFERLEAMLLQNRYRIKLYRLCSTAFGVPMRRPRLFLAASLDMDPLELDISPYRDTRILDDYLRDDQDEALILPNELVERYSQVLNIVNRNDQAVKLICFTRGYYQCRNASGSLIRLSDGRVRLVSAEEILSLLGFDSDYHFPPSQSLAIKLKLAGNSVDVRAVKSLLDCLRVFQ